MVLDSSLKFLSSFSAKNDFQSKDEDYVDTMHIFTSFLLVGFGLIAGYNTFSSSPLTCADTDQCMNIGCQEYAENFCWAQDTYYVPFTEVVAGMPQSERRERKISYYQWVPFFLLIQAAFFRLPSLVWKYMAGYSGIKVHEIVKLASDSNNVKPDIKQSNVKQLSMHLLGALRFHRRLQKKQITPHKIMRVFNLPYSAFFVTSMYLLTKFLYLINVCIQLFIMNKFLETDRYSWYGFGALADLLNGTTWEKTGVFPRVSLCDFDVRVMGNVQPHTIQCVLVINIFNEKIFIFLWFWYVTLLLFTALSFVYWLIVTILPSPNQRFISRHMEMSEMPFDSEASKDDVRRFINTYLKSDGAFIIRMITMHSGVIFATDLVLSLWKSFYGIEEQYRQSTSAEVGGNSKWTWPPPPGPLSSGEGADNKSNFLRLRKRPKSAEDVQDELTKKLLPPEVPPKPSAPNTLDEPDSARDKSKSARFEKQTDVDEI